jgi:DNA-binding NarL/FixJ family response regulator
LTEMTDRLFPDVCQFHKSYTVGMINILLVEDDANLRKGIQMRLALEADFQIIAETGDGREALALARAARPDVIIMDLRLPGLDGLEITRQLRETHPKCRVVILTLYDEDANRQRACKIGAAAFVSKQEPGDALVRAIRSAAKSIS